jgi:putative ABC transport system ATP-binding protein
MTGTPIVHLADVTRTFGEGAVAVHALRGVSLTLQTGAFAAMAGPSGSGKSTLLNVIGALDRPTTGRVEVAGIDLATVHGAARSRIRRDRIGFVFQSYNLVPVLTAVENAEYVLLLQGVPARERRDRVRAVLDAVGLGGLENRYPGQLSGGQQQRVAVARAIAPEPALVLADEPTANVDSDTGARLLDVMHALHEDKGVAFLFSTHDRSVMTRADRLLLLHDGRIVADGAPADVLDGR